MKENAVRKIKARGKSSKTTPEEIRELKNRLQEAEETLEAIKSGAVDALVVSAPASGYTMDIIKTRELTEAGFEFILKPVLPKDLLKKVREILDK
jgi:hypothetical protein